MTNPEPTTPRGARRDLTDANATEEYAVGGVFHVLDNSPADMKQQQRKINEFLAAIGTNVRCNAFKPMGASTRFSLTPDSLDNTVFLRENVKKLLRYPYSIEYSANEGIQFNQNNLDDNYDKGIPTLVIVRKNLYVPATKQVSMIIKIGATGLVFGMAIYVLVWLLTIN